jgi:astacin
MMLCRVRDALFWLVLAAASAACLAAEKPAGQPTGPAATILGTVEIDGRLVTYRVVDGFAVAFGDIILGPVEEIERRKQASGRREAAVVSEAIRLWPNATVSYVLDSGLSAAVRERFLEAVAQWEADTPLRFVPPTSETSYVRVRQSSEDSGSCVAFASVGRATGETTISLEPSCPLDVVIHEMGHTVGLWHEQQRQDRDRYIELLYSNLEKTRLSDYDTKILAGSDDGPYDYSSLMHYSLYGGSRNGKPTMRTLPPGLPLGGSRLSPGDIDAVRRLYGSPPSSVTVTTNPAGVQIVVDGRTLTSPQTFAWAPGESHTLSLPSPQGTGDIRHVFGRWSNDGPQTQTIVASSTTYVAHMIRQCKVGFSPSSDAMTGSYTVSPLSPDNYYTCDSEITLQATPASGQAFQTWNWTDLASNNPVTFTVDVARGAIYPAFTDRPMVTINTSPPGLPVSVDGVTTWTPPRNYVWTTGSRHTLVAGDQQDGLIRYVFSDWSNGGTASQSIVAPEGSATYVANFKTRYRLTTSVEGTGSVSASPSSADGYYDAGTAVQLTAQPVSSFSFWTGDTTGTANPQSVVMDDERVAVAHFAPLGSPTISALIPASVVAGTAPFLLNLTGPGNGFYEGLTQVRWNGVLRPFHAVSSREIQIQLSAADLSTAGRATISVSNPGFADSSDVFTVTAPPSGCTPTLSPASLSLGSYGGSATVGVSTGSGCAWSATAEAAWVEVIPVPRAFGSGTLNLWVAPNSSSQSRTSTVRVAGQAITISQAGAPCNVTLAPSSNTMPNSGGSGSVVLILLVSDCRWTATSSAAWLRFISATSGTGNAVITYAAEANRDQTSRTAEIRVGNQTATVQQAGGWTGLALVSAASYIGGAPLAPGSLAAAFGQGLARETVVATLPLPGVLAGTRLVFQKPDKSFITAPLLFVSPGQINFVVPSLPDGTTTMVATIDEKGVSTGAVEIQRVAPGLFSANADGRGVALAWAVKVAASGTQTSQLTFQCGAAAGSCVSIPIDLGGETDQVILLLFGTGIGIHGGSALSQVTATIGGVNAEVLYAGLQGDFAGLDQVNVRLPRSLAGRGEVNVGLMVEGKTANTVTVNVQ